jgi:hypothetical protein
MVRHDGAETRRERIMQIAKSVHAALYQNKEVGVVCLSKTVAQLEIESGLTKTRILEYFGILESAGQFELDFKNDVIRRSKMPNV